MMADALHSPAKPRLTSPLDVPDLAQVYERHVDYVWRCLRSLGVRGPALDDAVQDVFLVVQAKLAAFDGQARLTTWLYAIVIRVARRYRGRAIRDAAALVERDPADPVTPERRYEQNERLAIAEQILLTLDYDKREVFVLAQVEQMSAPEIAEVTGAPLNTVYSRLRSARLAFRQEAARARLRGTFRSLATSASDEKGRLT